MDSSSLVEFVGAAAIGDVLTLEIYRQGETITVTMAVGEQQQTQLLPQDQFPPIGGQGSNPFGSFGGRR